MLRVIMAVVTPSITVIVSRILSHTCQIVINFCDNLLHDCILPVLNQEVLKLPAALKSDLLGSLALLSSHRRKHPKFS